MRCVAIPQLGSFNKKASSFVAFLMGVGMRNRRGRGGEMGRMIVVRGKLDII